MTIYRDTTDLDTSTEITLLIEGSEEETVWLDGDYRDGSATNIHSEVNRLERSAKTVNKELGLSLHRSTSWNITTLLMMVQTVTVPNGR